MENLLFCLNATVPIFLTMMLGCLFKKIGWIDELFTKRLNKFVFQVALPALLFEDLATVDLAEVWDMGYVAYCFAATFLGIGICYLISLLLKDKSIQGEFVQASYRSSAALMGIAIIQNIYGNAGMAPLMIIGTVPLYNVMAVVILSVLKPERGKVDKALLLKTGKGIVTNPIILGILAGMIWSGLRLPMPKILDKTVSNVGVLATPLGLMALGASNWRDARLYTRASDCSDRDARLCQHGELLCYGEKYGTRRHADIQRRCFDNIVFCVDDDWMAVYFPDNGTGVMED